MPLPEPHSIVRDSTSYVVREVPPSGALLDQQHHYLSPATLTKIANGLRRS